MVKIIKKYTSTKTINGRKYIHTALFVTLEEAEKYAKAEPFVTEIFKLVAKGTKYPYRVYYRQPIRIYDPKSGEFKLVK